MESQINPIIYKNIKDGAKFLFEKLELACLALSQINQLIIYLK